MASRQLDARDRRIIEVLRCDAWITYATLGRLVHLSASAVQRRVERLIEEGVILGAEAKVALAAPLRILLLAELADDAAATIERFATAIAGAPAVVEAHYVTGEADVALTLELADMAAYDAFVARHINGSRLVRRFKTFATLRRLK